MVVKNPIVKIDLVCRERDASDHGQLLVQEWPRKGGTQQAVVQE